MSKITKATFKAFIRKNQGKLFIKNLSSFDGMTDCVEFSKNPEFRPTKKSELYCPENTCDISGVWLVDGSGNRFSSYDDEKYVGISCYNCCGSFIIGIEK